MIDVQHIDHSFTIGKKGRENEVPVLKDVSLSVAKGEIACIVGRSGSGKSTLLNLISGYISPTKGGLSLMALMLRGLMKRNGRNIGLTISGLFSRAFSSSRV